MHAIADTDKLVADGIITTDQARTIEVRARQAMVMLAINSVLCFGIIAATSGLIVWLADPMAVAVGGTLALVIGLLILAKSDELFAMFGNAAALIGAGMLIGGASIELMDKYKDIAGWSMIFGGAVILLITARALLNGGLTARFVTGSILLMGLAVHIVGLGYLLDQGQVSGVLVSLFYLYAAVLLFASGWLTNVRLVSALAIIPFAQMLDTGTFYFHAAYAFYSPEPTLSILQMALLIALCVWAAKSMPERTARHVRVLGVLAFVIANLCALVGSLWGDVVGETIWGPGHYRYDADMTWQEFGDLREAFELTALVISENVFSVLWAVALAGMIFWSAQRSQRGLFNTAITFAAIHAYTQMFESFGDEPLAYVLGGIAAIPLAWGMWRLNHWIVGKEQV